MSRWLPRIDAPGAGGGGGLETDHFAPTIIVGNTPAGDPADAQAAPFQYIADPGDGTGVAAALAAAAALGTGAWVHIRRGSYNLGLPGSPALPLSVDAVRVTGDGPSTFLLMSSDVRSVFVLTSVPAASPVGRPAGIEDLAIGWKAAAPGAAGTALVDCSACPRAVLDNVRVINTAAPVENADESLTSIFLGGLWTRFTRCLGINIDGNVNAGVVVFRMPTVGGSASACLSLGGNVGARLESFSSKISDMDISAGPLFATATGVEVDGLQCVVEGSVVASVTDGIVAESGAGVVINGNVFGPGFGGDGIRVEAGATDCIVVANRLNGNAFVDAGAGTESGHNTP